MTNSCRTIEAAARQLYNFSDGSYFVSLASFSSPAFLSLAIADALGLVKKMVNYC